MSILLFATGPEIPIGHLLGAKKIIFLIRDIDDATMARAHRNSSSIERDSAGAPRLDPDAALLAPAGDADELGHDRRRAEAGTVVVCTCLPHATGPARYEIT